MDIFIRPGGAFPRGGVLTVGMGHKPGDPPPSGYCDWHEWADVQYKAGLRQKRCGRCVKLFFPQELSDLIDVDHPFKSDGTHVRVESPVCKGCAEKNPAAKVFGPTPLPKKKPRKRKPK